MARELMGTWSMAMGLDLVEADGGVLERSRGRGYDYEAQR